MAIDDENSCATTPSNATDKSLAEIDKPFGIKPSEYVQSPLITIFVGPKRKEFKVFRDLLVAKSAFFKNALKDDWDHKGEIYLGKENSEAFVVLVDWMFTGTLLIEIRDMKRGPLLASTYVLADFLLMPRAKNAIIDAQLMHWSSTGTSYNFVGLKSISEGNAIDTPFGHMCIRSLTRRFMKSTARGLDENLAEHPLALFAFVKSLEAWREKPWDHPNMEAKCTWHDHSDGSQCGE